MARSANAPWMLMSRWRYTWYTSLTTLSKA